MSDQVNIAAPAVPDGATAASVAFRSFAGGVAFTFATRLLMLFGVVGASVIAARWLGPQGFGTLAVLTATVALVVQIGSMGLPSANTYFVARDRKLLGPVWANSIAFSLVGGGLLALALVVVARQSPDLFGGVSTSLMIIAALAIPFQLLSLFGLNVLLAMDRIRQLNLLDSLSAALALVSAVVVLIVLRSNLTWLVSINTAATAVVSLWMIWAMARLVAAQKEQTEFRLDGRLFKRTIGYALKFCISVAAAILIFRVDLLIVNHFRGPAEAGVYAVASQVGNLLMMLPGVIATLLFPRVASSQDHQGDFAIKVSRHASALMLLLCTAAAAGAFILPIIYGARFADATIQLLILLPGVYLVSIESVLVQHFTGTGLPLIIPVFWMITLAVNLVLNFALVPTYGARGAALASALSYALIFILVAVYFCLKTGRGPAEIFLLRTRELRELLVLVRLASPTRAHG